MLSKRERITLAMLEDKQARKDDGYRASNGHWVNTKPIKQPDKVDILQLRSVLHAIKHGR